MSIVRLLFGKWWVIALQGMLLIILSIYIFQNPAAVLTGISFWFGILVLATGLLGIVSWVAARNSEGAVLSLLWSLLTASFGLLMLMNMFATMKAITVFFGIWMLVTGLQLVRSGWALRNQNPLGWVTLGAGVLSAAAATMMILNMGAGAVGVSTLFGMAVMLTGVALVLLSFAKKVLGSRVKAALVVCALALCPARAMAQAAPAPAPPPPPPAREGSAEFALVGTTGNASTQTISLGGDLILRSNLWAFRNRAAFARNESEDTLTAESFQYLFRAERALSSRAAFFGEYGYFRDEFAGVEHRNGLLGGLSYKVIDRAAHLLSVDAGLGYLDEQRVPPPDVSSGTYVLGGAYRWKFSSTAELSEEARFTGTFDEADDWRVAQILAVTARLTSLFSLKASSTVRFVNVPVSGFKNTDTNTAIALVAKF